jgi:hypothetical protein
VPDARSHRGPNPRDEADFGSEALSALRSAAGDLSWLLSRHYAPVAALKLVGDRWELTARQRMAVFRSACSDDALKQRTSRRIELSELAGLCLDIDGFNVLTTVEAALGGAVVLIGRDGCLRDVAGVHGTYRKVSETVPAAVLIGETLSALGANGCTWHLDRPVSNSGRLRAVLLTIAEEHGWNWDVALEMNPDPVLIASARVVASADSVVIDHCGRWLSLARAVVETHVVGANAVDLSV